MKTFITLAVALGIAAGATAPAFAAEPKSKADCEKAHMKWDDSAKKCTK
jgi:ABC-type proline/glycine betaine transport system substrate-binding protein